MNAPCRSNPDTPELIADRRAELLAALEGFVVGIHVPKPEPRPKIDEVKVERAISGEAVELNLGERREVIDYLHFHGLSARQIALRVGATGRAVERRIQHLRDQRYRHLTRAQAGIDVQNVCDDERSTQPEQRTA